MPTYDDTIGEYVARDLDGNEVFGQTWTRCMQNVSAHNEAIIAERQRYPDDDCTCEPDDVSACPRCLATIAETYGDAIPY